MRIRDTGHRTGDFVGFKGLLGVRYRSTVFSPA